MQISSPNQIRKLVYPLIIAASLLAGSALGAPADGDAIFHEIAPALNQLDPLARQFDTDQNQTLSPEEQQAMIDFVAKQKGEVWADRLKRFLATADANHDGTIDLKEWTYAVAQVRKAAKTRPTVAQAQTFQIAMRDGVHLATDVYLPEGPGPFPVIFSRTPYGRTNHIEGALGFAADGYVAVVQDMRGRFGSAGENLPFIGGGWGEHQDGVDTIEWLKKQTWCNGRIGTVGVSAGGITQNLLAGAAPAGLTAQHLTVAAANMYLDAIYTGGALRQADIENWLANNNFDPQAIKITRAHPTYDDYWRLFDNTSKFAQINVPAVHIGGWFDIFTQGEIDEFVGRQHFGAEGARGNQKLVMGPWTHAIGRMPVGELTFPRVGKVPAQYSASRWFDHYLCGVDNGVEKTPAVAYYVMGDTSTAGAPGNEWRYADDWPIPAKETAAYFNPDGKLSFQPPAAGDDHVQYTFVPTNPCPTIGGNNLSITRGPMNQNPIEQRGDVVLFTSAPLTEPIEVTGRVKAKIFVASSAMDTDLSVRLCDVYPNGKSYLIAEGMLRLRYRHSFEKPEPLTPGKREEVTVDCWSTSIVFNRGHCIRATITSSNYPRFDLNPGTGQPWTDAAAPVTQTNTIYCNLEHPSELVLPVVTGTK